MKRRTFEFWPLSASSVTAVSILLVFLGACASSLPRLTPGQLQWASQRWPGEEGTRVEEGRSLYVAKCSGCHTLKLPNAYSSERWPTIMEKMAPKSKLTKEQEDQIMRYIVTLLEGPHESEVR